MALAHKEISTQELVRTPFFYPSTLGLDNATRLILEVGPGRGDFLFHLAETNPDSLVVGIEIKRKRVDKLIHRTEKRKLCNVIIIQDDARSALPRFFSDGSVDEIHINFPDPWPKNRHSGNRSVSTDFLNECRRVLKDGGFVNFVTDFIPYAAAVSDDASRIAGLVACDDANETFPTFFAMKWKKMGRKFVCRRYVKTLQ